MTVEIRQGDARALLAGMAAQSVQCCITSPPYFNLRSYNGGAAEIGTEATPQAYIAHLVEVFSQVKRVLRDDGVLFVVLGDSYASSSTYNTTNSLHTAAGWKQDGARRPNVRATPDVESVPYTLFGGAASTEGAAR